MKRGVVVLLSVLGSLFAYSASIDLSDEVVLNRKNSDFTFYFADFKADTNYQCIKYRLLPDAQEWATDSTNYCISFEQLGKGSYTLQIQPVYADGTRGNISNIKINVLPNWSQTWWAFVCYLLLAGGVLLILWWHFVRKMKIRDKYKKNEMEMAEKLFQSQMQRVQERNDNFLRNQLFMLVARELLTPLSLIVAPLRELLSSSLLPSHYQSRMSLAYRNSLEMQDTCNQLLFLYKAGNNTNELDVCECNILKLTDNIVKSLAELVKSNRMDFQYKKLDKENFMVWIDKPKMDFVIRNLLSNALRHIAYSGTVSLEVSEDIMDGKPCCLVRIWDNGDEVVEKTPANFFDAGSDNNDVVDFSKMELGYTLLENVVKLHQGKIDFDSRKGEGTMVRFCIPVGKEHFENLENINFVEAAEISDDSVEELNLRTENVPVLDVSQPEIALGNKKKMLVVEDNRDIRTYLQVLFAAEYVVLEARNGQEGVDMALKEEPDLVLCDVMMPVKDGFECCREIKENLKTCHIPVIMLTARIEDEDIIRGIELGADDYLLKPFNPDVLKAKVKNLIRNRSSLKQAYMKLLMLPIENEQKDEQPLESVEDKMLGGIMRIIAENIEDPEFNVKKLAEKMNMSQPTLYRKVKQSTGFTIVELIRGARLKRAAVLLKERTYTVQEVVERVGYNDAPTFRKHFVDFFGVTPSSYGAQESST